MHDNILMWRKFTGTKYRQKIVTLNRSADITFRKYIPSQIFTFIHNK